MAVDKPEGEPAKRLADDEDKRDESDSKKPKANEDDTTKKLSTYRDVTLNPYNLAGFYSGRLYGV